MLETKIVITSSGLGAGKKGAELGPSAFRIACANNDYDFFDGKETTVLENDHSLYSGYTKFDGEYLEQIISFNEESCEAIAEAVASSDRCIVLSGDHSNAVGSISGLRKALPNDKIGVIWIDAHADLHSPYSTPSFNIHGMPLAAVLGNDNQEFGDADPSDQQVNFWTRLKTIGGDEISPKIGAKDLVFIDIRDLETPEWNVIKQSGIKHFEPNDRRSKGIQQLINETLEHFDQYDTLYITFDVDSMDPSVSKGTGTPVPDGLSWQEAAELLKAFYHHEKCRMLEITEINPLLDTENKMAKTVVKVLREAGI